MRCPTCEKQIGWDWLEDECIDPNEEFECPLVVKLYWLTTCLLCA